MTRGRGTSILEASNTDQSGEDEKEESWGLPHMDRSPAHTLFNMNLLIQALILQRKLQGQAPQLIPDSTHFRRFPEQGRSPSHISTWGTKVSFIGEDSPRPMYYP